MIVCASQIFNVPSAMLQAYRKTAWAARAGARVPVALYVLSPDGDQSFLGRSFSTSITTVVLYGYFFQKIESWF